MSNDAYAKGFRHGRAARDAAGDVFRRIIGEREPFILNGVRFAPMLNPGPISWSYGGGSEEKKDGPQPYLYQEEMEACMARNPTLTEEKYKAMMEAFGF